ncbi:MAG TPA: O-antigen ligase family protein [Bryobacteraceae bacterium]|nr:O-antigen ligase family protein [Bryobacteraceae bacterium]
MSANSFAIPMPLLPARRALEDTRPARHAFGVLDFLLCTYVVLLPWQIEIVVDFRVAPSDLFLFLALILGGISLRYVAPAWSIWQLSLPVLFGIGTLVSVAAEGELSRYVLVNKCVGLGVLFLFYMLVTTTTRSWLSIRRVLQVLVVSVTLENIASLAAFLAGRSYGLYVPWLNGNPYRLCGALVDANAYGGLLVLTLTINEVASSGEAPLMNRIFKNFASLTLLLGIVCTFSRSAWMALATIWIATWFFRRRVALRMAVAAVAAALATPLFGAGVLVYARDMASRPDQIAQRLDIITNAGAYISQHPFLGIGLGGYLEREGVIVHNTSLWFLTEFGVIGLFVLFGFLGWFLWKGMESYRRAPVSEKPLVLSLVLAHVGTFVLSMGIEAFYTRPWWLIFGLIASSYCITLREGAAVRYIPAAFLPVPKEQS